MRTPKIIYTQFGGKCPVQGAGTIDGHPFYFRSRGGHWSLSIMRPGGDTLDYANAWYVREPYNGKLAYRDAEIGDGRTLAAGWAEEEECKAFIEKHATRWANGEAP